MGVPSNLVRVQGQTVESADSLNTLVQWTTNVVSLRAFTGALNDMLAYMEGTTTPGDGGQGFFYYNSSSTAPDDGVNTIVPSGNLNGAWLRLGSVAGAVPGEVTVPNGTVTAVLGSMYVATGPFTLNLPTSASSSKFLVTTVTALSGAVTVGLLTGADKINGGTSGVGLIIPLGGFAEIVNDAAGNYYIAITAMSGTKNVSTGFLFGLTLSNDGTLPNTVIDISAGSCRDSSDADFMALPTGINKTTGAWAVGSGNGGLDTGSVANSTWYHVFVIKREDTGVVDALLSLSATAPTLPTSYSLFRRIGSILTDSSGHIITFVQTGDDFYWASPVGDVAATNPGTSAVTRTLTVPTGIRVKAKIMVMLIQSAAAGTPGACYISDLSVTDIAALNAAPATQMLSNSVAGTFAAGSLSDVWTNTSAQVRSRLQASAASTTLNMGTLGWLDYRGRLF